MKKIISFILLLCVSVGFAHAQKIIQGHIYGGLSSSSPVDSMRIYTTSGNVTYTNKNGLYIISAKPLNDTLYVSYQGREIIHYPVSYITVQDKFDIYLNNPGFYDTTYYHRLNDVVVTKRNYVKDSLRDRLMYSKVFDYTKPRFNPFSPVTSISNLFKGDYINRQKVYRKFAESNEQYGYVQSRWTRSLVSKITHIDDDSVLTKFMQEYEPSYSKMKDMNELELYQYISDSYKVFTARNPAKKE